MKEKEENIVKGIRSKYWGKLQEIADEQEMGNLNHLVNKIFHSFITNIDKKKKNGKV